MDTADKGRLMTTMGVSGGMFLLVPAHPGCPRQNPENRKTVVCVGGVCSNKCLQCLDSVGWKEGRAFGL